METRHSIRQRCRGMRAAPIACILIRIGSAPRSTKMSPHHQNPPSPLSAGTVATDFTLHTTPDQTVALRDFRGQPVVLAFYPADWSPVCSDQMALYNEI